MSTAGDDKRALKRYMYASTHGRTHTQQYVRVQPCVCICVYIRMRVLSDTPCVRSSPENVSSIAHCVSEGLSKPGPYNAYEVAVLDENLRCHRNGENHFVKFVFCDSERYFSIIRTSYTLWRKSFKHSTLALCGRSIFIIKNYYTICDQKLINLNFIIQTVK